ncbi:MAG: L,D-transpeptidase family protein [Pyrinomonadaceae bacterium]
MNTRQIFMLALPIFAAACFGVQRGATALMSNPQPNEARRAEPPDSPATTSQAPLKLPLVNPKIFVSKSQRRLELYSDGRIVRTYRVGLGLSPVEDKVKQGDHRTPEGEFYVCVKNAHSKFYLSLGLSYPNTEDAARGLRDGLITKAQHEQIVSAIKRGKRPPWDTALGGEIFIHGHGSQTDWTWGCVALENTEMKELFDAVPLGTPVTIKR